MLGGPELKNQGVGTRSFSSAEFVRIDRASEWLPADAPNE